MRAIAIGLALLLSSLSLGAASLDHNDPLSWLHRLSREELSSLFKKKAEGNDGNQNQAPDRKKGKKGFALGAALNEMFMIMNGAFPDGAGKHNNCADMDLWLEDPDGSIKRLEVTRSTNMVSVPNRNGGWYELYAYMDRGVYNGARYRCFMQSGFFNHGDPVKKRLDKTAERAGFIGKRPLLEIQLPEVAARERYAVREGDVLQARVLFRGKPATGGIVTLMTGKGWQKKVGVDAAGTASFTLIKENFPTGKVNKRTFQRFLLVATYHIDGTGSFAGEPYEMERYQTTLPLTVYPSPLEWTDKQGAYFVTVFVIGIISTIAAIRRNRRRKDAGR